MNSASRDNPPPGTAPAGTTPSATDSPLERLLAKLQSARDFPATAAAIREVNLLAGADDSGNLRGLSAAVQKDYALAQRLLRLVNSSAFRPSGAEPVSTVSRAIELLGLNRVRSLAASLVLFEPGGQAARTRGLRDEFLRAVTAGSIADSVVRGGDRLAEEAGLAAMFHRLGRVLVMAHMPIEAEAMHALDASAADAVTREREMRRLLGVSLDELGEAVALSWGFPPILLQGFRRPRPQERIPLIHGPEARIRVACGLAAELCEAIDVKPGPGVGALALLARRYRPSLHVDESGLEDILRTARNHTIAFARSVGLALTDSEFGRGLLRAGRPAAQTDPDAAQATADARVAESGEAGPAGASAAGPAKPPAPSEASAGLAQTLALLSGQLADGVAMNELVRSALQGLRDALGCERVIFATREPRTDLLLARQGLGRIGASSLSHFRVAMNDDADLLGVSTRKGIDLLITDAGDPRVASRLAAWQRQHFPAAGFLLLPVLLDGQPRALIYADSAEAGRLALDAAALSMLRGIRSQLVLALRQTHRR